MPNELSDSLAQWQQASVEGSFEDSLNALESIVAHLDSGDLTLDESIACFEIGARLSSRCQQLLEQAELRIELVQRSLEVEPSSEPPF